MSFTILGLDPGFASMGYCVAIVDKDDVTPILAGVVTTKKLSNRRGTFAGDDNIRRLNELSDKLIELITENQPALICSEGQSWVRSAMNNAKLGMYWGAVAMVARQTRTPLRLIPPQDLKRILTGNEVATKEEVAWAVYRRWPEFPNLLSVPESKQEHAYDAGGAILCSLESETIQAMRSVLR